MIQQARATLVALGLDPSRVHSEQFTAPPPTTPSAGSTGKARSITVVHAGTPTTLAVHAGETVLDAGLRAGLGLPHSCRAGACGSCEANISGDRRPVLACQLISPPAGATVDFDAKQAPIVTRSSSRPYR